MVDLKHLAVPGSQFAVRVTPKAARADVLLRDGQIRVNVTVVPEDGKANAAVLVLLSKALGVPKSRLTVMRGHTSRDKVIAVT
ncbi:DUF167 domain-containing protein [Yoonia sp.]|uniref:DUF167 domain-containing protein n=1 Tax=Yoonia sp. TaxID=2212373 RepID=UPI001A075239|nr:DUF167 domain-containing protein [Yoonia sp.]MBE0413578.1 DUF167 domain-containing protein [Yoonia sp.]